MKDTNKRAHRKIIKTFAPQRSLYQSEERECTHGKDKGKMWHLSEKGFKSGTQHIDIKANFQCCAG